MNPVVCFSVMPDPAIRGSNRARLCASESVETPSNRDAFHIMFDALAA